MNPRHLTHDAQASALAEWGRGGSFRCVACGRDCTDERPALAVPTAFPGFALGACRIGGGGAMKSVLNCGGKQ